MRRLPSLSASVSASKLSCLTIAAIVCLSATPAALADSSETLVDQLVQDSQRHKVTRKVDRTNPVWLAEQYASGLADDVPQFNDWMLELVKAYVASGHVDEAAYVADRLPGSGSALAHADLAVFQARCGEVKAAERHLAAAQNGLGSATLLQADGVRSRCALALHLMHRTDEAAALAAQLGELELLQLDTRLQEEGMHSPQTAGQAQARLHLLQAKGVDEARCRYLLACARRHFKNGNVSAGLPFLPLIGDMASSNGLPPAQHVLVALARAAWMAGQQDEARKSLNLFLKCCESYADHAEWKAPFLADAAALLIDWQRKDEARAWLRMAEASLGKVYILDAPKAILAVGRQFERLDGADAGDRFATMAAQAGSLHPHPRARASAAVQVCLFYAGAARPVPNRILDILNRAAKGESE